jgi:hypothetical protein
MALKNRMFVDELEMMWMKVTAYLKVLCKHSTAEINENHIKLSVSIACLQAKTQTWDLMNTKQWDEI